MASAISMSMLGLFILLLLSALSFKFSTAQMVPAMFVFGDSVVDVGNNNYLPFCVARADFPNNGIDFPTQKPTGRFCNGKNAADLLAEKLKVPSPPPFLSRFLLNNDTSFLNGANFASGGSGIFNGTGRPLGVTLTLTEQVNRYLSVYHNHLVHKLGSDGAKNRTFKSLFLIVTGNNDLLTYSRSKDHQRNKTTQQFINLMLLLIKRQIKRLHDYGARKFVVTGVGLLGCSPSQRINSKEQCNGNLNSWSLRYNEGLKSMLHKLKAEELKDINYSCFNTAGVLQSVIQKPAAYGFSEVKAACCGLGKLNAEIPCLPISTYCSNRSNHVFWDMIHPTQATNHLLVDTIFDRSSHYTVPMNVRQLVAV